MSRVAWSTLSGEEAETVISLLIYNQFPRATRVRPSQGDFGIDVQVPRSSAESVDIYQIKKFAVTLNSSQRKQIKNSFKRVMVGLLREGIKVEDWYLVMPLDPTLADLKWLKNMPSRVITEMSQDHELALTADELEHLIEWVNEPTRIIDWKGLTYCEKLASEYWFVPDYYLHGGRERVRAAVETVGSLLHTDLDLRNRNSSDATSLLQPGEISEHIKRLQLALDGDPHYRYGISLDPHAPDLKDPGPNVIAAVQEIAPDGTCITYRIYARFAEAENIRPIPIHVEFEFEDEGSGREAFDEWLRYGSTITGNATVNADLPGGLNSVSRGTITITPVDDEEKSERRFRIVSPDGEVKAEISTVGDLSTGISGKGIRYTGADPAGLLSVTYSLNLDSSQFEVNFALLPITGRNAAETLPATNFAAHSVAPNNLEIAEKFGPYSPLMSFTETEPLIPEVINRLIHALTALQPYRLRQRCRSTYLMRQQ